MLLWGVCSRKHKGMAVEVSWWPLKGAKLGTATVLNYALLFPLRPYDPWLCYWGILDVLVQRCKFSRV